MFKLTQNYLEREVLQGSPIDHIVLLYGKAITCLKQVQKFIEEGVWTPETIKSRAENLGRVIDILVYLEAILDLEKGGEIAKNLKEIYQILINELIKVNFSNELKPIQDSLEILENLRKVWLEIKPKLNFVEKDNSFQALSIKS